MPRITVIGSPVAEKPEREAGEVRVRKDVRTDRKRISVPTRHEEVSVERVPVEGREASEAEIGEDEVSMSVTEDEVVVERRPMVKEEIRVRKDAVHDEEVIEEDVRREEVDVEDVTTTRGRRGEGRTAQDIQPERRAEEERPGREEDLQGRKDSQKGREDSRDDTPEEGISPEKISGRTHTGRRPQEGISPDTISGG